MYLTRGSVYILILVSHFVPSSLSLTVTTCLFSTSASLFLPWKYFVIFSFSLCLNLLIILTSGWLWIYRTPTNSFFFFTYNLVHFILIPSNYCMDFPDSSVVKNLPASVGGVGKSLGGEDPLEKEMVTHSSILAWENPWTEEPGRLKSMGFHRVGHNLASY